METKTKKIEKEYYVESCPHCGYEIAGTSKTQVQWNLDTHIRSKHPDKIKNE